MSSEWLKVMLEEIARKRAEAEQARAEQARAEQAPAEPARRTTDDAGGPPPRPDADPTA